MRGRWDMINIGIRQGLLTYSNILCVYTAYRRTLLNILSPLLLTTLFLIRVVIRYSGIKPSGSVVAPPVTAEKQHRKIWVGGTHRKGCDDVLTPPLVFGIGGLIVESRLYPTSCFEDMFLELQLSFIPHPSFQGNVIESSNLVCTPSLVLGSGVQMLTFVLPRFCFKGVLVGLELSFYRVHCNEGILNVYIKDPSCNRVGLLFILMSVWSQ